MQISWGSPRAIFVQFQDQRNTAASEGQLVGNRSETSEIQVRAWFFLKCAAHAFYFAPVAICACANISAHVCIFIMASTRTGRRRASRRRVRSKPAEERGGYDCEFVVPPPEGIQAECPVCLTVLKEPCVIDCPCGQKMCRECVERIKEAGKPCPLCNKTDFSYIRDYGFERYLNSCDVWCSGCGWRGKLGEFEQHFKDDCPLTKVSCPLHYAGCEVELPRKDMPEHMKDTVTHFTLLGNATRSLMKENQELKEKQRATEEKRKKEVAVLKEEMQQLRLSLSFPIYFQVNYPSEEEMVYLPSFYAHPHGYLMCLGVYPNGLHAGKGTHVSIYTCLMKGPFDDHLKWPFRGDITIQIVNQDGDHHHVEWTIHYTEITPYAIASRVTGSKERATGWGFHKFLAHTNLGYKSALKTQYLKDDIIIVRVVRVTIRN